MIAGSLSNLFGYCRCCEKSLHECWTAPDNSHHVSYTQCSQLLHDVAYFCLESSNEATYEFGYLIKLFDQDRWKASKRPNVVLPNYIPHIRLTSANCQMARTLLNRS